MRNYIIFALLTLFALGLISCTVHTTDIDKTTFIIYNNTNYSLVISDWDSKGNSIYDTILADSTTETILTGPMPHVYYDPVVCLLKLTVECIEYVGETKYEFDIRNRSLYQRTSDEDSRQLVIDSLWWEASRKIFGL